MPREGVCLYCDSHTTNLTDEHVLPADIGATLIVPACGDCNAGAARDIDTPAMAFPDVGQLCGLYDVRNARHRRRKRRFEMAGDLTDGSRALYRPHADKDLVQVTAAEPAVNPDGSFTFAFPEEDYEHLRNRLQAKLEARYPDREVSFGEPWRTASKVGFSATRAFPARIWPRFTAKVALGIGYWLFEEPWRRSYAADQLRSIMRCGVSLEGATVRELGMATEPRQLGPDDRWFCTLRPWEHLVVATGDGTTMRVRIVLFGELDLTIAVSCEYSSDPQTVAWLFDAKRFSVESYSAHQFAVVLGRRVVEEGSTAGLHLDRPRARRLDGDTR